LWCSCTINSERTHVLNCTTEGALVDTCCFQWTGSTPNGFQEAFCAVHTLIYTRIYIYFCICRCICIYKYTHTHTCTHLEHCTTICRIFDEGFYACICTYVSGICLCVFACMCACACVCVFVCARGSGSEMCVCVSFRVCLCACFCVRV